MSQPQPQDQTFPLSDIALTFLRRSEEGAEERVFFGQHGRDGIDASLAVLLASGLPPQPALEGLLGLAYVLERTEESPTAATLIRDVVASQPWALRALGLEKRDGVELRRGAAHLTGASAQDLAPVFGKAAPKGAVSVASLLDPIEMERSRVNGGGAIPSRRQPSPAPKAGSAIATPRRKFGVS